MSILIGVVGIAFGFLVGGILMFKYLQGDFTVKTKDNHSTLTYSQKMSLQNIICSAIVQGPHSRNLTMIYKMIITEARKTFTEDNNITLASWMLECQQEAYDDFDLGTGIHYSSDHINPDKTISVRSEIGS